ncbi:glycosyltransferase family 9 protein [Myxococcota bacterium]|nr:glycosyltransferase family 9 protein [Myxococcota bacterium]
MSAELGRVVVVDPAFLGDVVFDGPLVRALRASGRASFVGLVVRPPADAIAQVMAGVDRVHVFDKRGRDRGYRGLARIAAELRAERYDTALVPHPSPRSALLVQRARIGRRIGSAPGIVARLLLTEHVPESAEDTFVTARLRLAGLAAADPRLAGTLGPISQRPRDRARIGLVLGSNWATKRWALEQAARFVESIDPSTSTLVLLGAPFERPLFDELLRRAPAALAHAEAAHGGGVMDLVGAIAGCDVVVAGDTGPLHVARALGIPVVALFGPTSERRHGFEPADHVLAVDLPCRPCSAHGQHVCPEVHHRCMRELAAERVVGAVAAVLRGPGGSPA